MRPAALFLASTLLAAPALAEDEPELATAVPAADGAEPAPVEDDEPPPPPVVLRQVPPRFSWEMAFQVSYGMVPEFEGSPPWAGFGLRGAWGRHWGNHRVGVGAGITFEGPVGVQWANVLEPVATYDWVYPKGAILGLSAGPSLVLAVDTHDRIRATTLFGAGFQVSGRVGYSQPFSLVARRFFVAAEPKLRWVDGNVSGLVSIVLGSGRGY